MKKQSASSHPDLLFSKAKQTGNNIMSVDEFKAYTGKESSLQAQCENYLELMKIDYIRIPDELFRIIFAHNEVSRKIPVWYKALISGFLKGLPDLMLFKRDEIPYNKALFIELKTAKGKL